MAMVPFPVRDKRSVLIMADNGRGDVKRWSITRYDSGNDVATYRVHDLNGITRDPIHSCDTFDLAFSYVHSLITAHLH
jgi:hypothetical protein